LAIARNTANAVSVVTDDNPETGGRVSLVPVTTSSADVFYLAASDGVEDVAVDDHPMSDAEAVAKFENSFTPVPADAPDVDVTGDDAFGV
jgi:hypothetical protein